MKTSNLIKTLTLLTIVLVFFSCSKDDSLKNKTAIKFESSYLTSKSTSLKSTLVESVVIESFKINIEEIEIEFNDDDPLFDSDTVATDIELEGPFEIDLIKNGNSLETFITSNVQLPSAAYDEIEFEFSKNENSASTMYGKSVLIEGTINGTPFVFWTDEEIEVEIEFEEIVYLDEASKAVLTISFNLSALFNPALGGIDITNATDGNENGIIEIFPGNTDGNNNLAELILQKIEDIIEAFEEDDDDDDDK